MNSNIYSMSADDLRKSIATVSQDEKGKQYLEYIKNQINSAPYANKEELLNVIDEAINGLNKEVTDEQAVEILKQKGNDFSNLNIVTTSKFENDSKKDLTYLTYCDSAGKTHMLECTNQNRIMEFINNHQGQDYTAADVYNYFRDNVYREVDFEDPLIARNSMSSRLDYAIKNDEQTKAIEKDKINHYIKEHNLHENVEIGVDYNGERIYRIGSTTITFVNIEGRRDLKVLDSPELRNEQQLNSENNQENVQTIQSDLENAGNVYVGTISPEEFNHLMEKMFNFHEELTGLEMQQMINYAQLLLEGMKERADNNQLESLEQIALDTYVENFKSSYNSIKMGMTPEYELNEQQMQQIEEYFQLKNYIEARVRTGELLLNPVKKLSLINNSNNNTSGIANILIILELCMLSLLTIIFMVR